jgi:hypothetical protein
MNAPSLFILKIKMKNGAAALVKILAVPKNIKQNYYITTLRYTPKRIENV